VNHRVDALLAQHGSHQIDVTGIALDKARITRHQFANTGTEIIDDNDMLPAFEQSIDHVAADIAGAAGDEDRHEAPPRFWLLSGAPDLRAPVNYLQEGFEQATTVAELTVVMAWPSP